MPSNGSACVILGVMVEAAGGEDFFTLLYDGCVQDFLAYCPGDLAFVFKWLLMV